MKNLHLIPTDKGQRITKTSKGTLLWCSKSAEDFIETRKGYLGFHLYITNDEEIKEGDWFIRDGSIHKCFKVHKTDIEFLTSIDSVYCGSNTFWSKEFCKKIILTTDQDLIEDGVQAIDDEFLEWFVKNPSCEEVEVGYGWIRLTETDNEGYWVSIPDKQFEMQQEEPKQETLEEAAERLFPDSNVQKRIFIKGAKWQQQRMYSEEDLHKAYCAGSDFDMSCLKGEQYYMFKEWFEQFKKK